MRFSFTKKETIMIRNSLSLMDVELSCDGLMDEQTFNEKSKILDSTRRKIILAIIQSEKKVTKNER